MGARSSLAKTISRPVTRVSGNPSPLSRASMGRFWPSTSAVHSRIPPVCQPRKRQQDATPGAAMLKMIRDDAGELSPVRVQAPANGLGHGKRPPCSSVSSNPYLGFSGVVEKKASCSAVAGCLARMKRK